ncbi:hypothetical protein NPIL_284891 [Nephila pilipes]|uniref:Uncharacterized protein n=1 Tax=Nephila pilipes TaxID=299642 RepID=A0A8X6IMM3_NEPPI|nr:hypothetical protein NPIL_284891 [Nephila pilipes]
MDSKPKLMRQLDIGSMNTKEMGCYLGDERLLYSYGVHVTTENGCEGHCMAGMALCAFLSMTKLRPVCEDGLIGRIN